ncbi:MAG: methyltransferase domain-containing protein [Betaproteobacteria bacterium]|nr:methyltransferase domain-containing protein [Betaproteobacteria bacterium]
MAPQWREFVVNVPDVGEPAAPVNPEATMAGPTSVELTPMQLFDASVAALEARHFAQARAGFEALRRDPALRADALHTLGVIAGLEGDHSSAASLIQEAIAVNRNRPEFFLNLALALAKAGKHHEARMARNDMGIALHVTKQYRDAVSVFEQILAETPNHLVTLVDIAASLNELGDFHRAMTCTARVLSNLRDRDARVLAVLEQIRAILPGVYDAATQAIEGPHADITGEERPLLLARALNNFANNALRIGSLDLAEAAYILSNALAPDEPLVSWNLSHLRLLRGDFEQGFAKYESRWQWADFNFPDRQLQKTLWRGEPVAGKRILVYAEQGFGDTIQFARLVPRLAERGAKVWFEVQQELFWLMKAAFHSDHRIEVIPRLPDPRNVYGDPPYDAHCGVMSLAKHLQLKPAELPGRSLYIGADPIAVARWSEMLGPRRHPRAGLVWAGRADHARDRDRSLSLDLFHEALALPGIEWISLQLGPPRQQIATCDAEIRDFGDELHDFAETAALIANLDLVVSADTAVAHLAGAMGKAVWVLLPFVPDWRWLLDREDSPWYPTARLFRQRELGNWDGVIQRVTAELEKHFGLTRPHRSADHAAAVDLAAATTACKICNQQAALFGIVDFEKNCEERNGIFRAASGVSVPYYRCSNCGLVFTRAFDDWDKERFVRDIYNDDYCNVDPDYAETRPRANAEFLSRLLRNKRDVRILDYGGGSGKLAELMRRDGFDCESWEPLVQGAERRPGFRQFNVVNAFEVFEHTSSPVETFGEAVGFLKTDGVMIFSTLAIDEYPPGGVSHWYVAPRNGHVTIYSRQALAGLASRYGFTLQHVNDDLHVAWHTKPVWLQLG